MGLCSTRCHGLPLLGGKGFQTRKMDPNRARSRISLASLAWRGLLLSQNMRIRFRPPPPTTEFLREDFCLQPGLRWKFLLRRTWSDENGSHCSFQDFHSLTKENQVSLLRIFFSEPNSRGKSTDLGVGGGKNDPENNSLRAVL